jgi:hypothetical protein
MAASIGALMETAVAIRAGISRAGAASGIHHRGIREIDSESL